MEGSSSVYKAPCPSCGQVNNLAEGDLGVRLSCGACGEGFVFGEEIARQKRAEDKKRRAEEAAAERRRIEETKANERAAHAELVRERAARAAEFDRLRESQRRAAEEHESSLALQSAPPQPVQVSYAAAPATHGPIDVRRQYGKNGIICPNLNCGFVGKAKVQSTRSSVTQLAAIFFCTVIGLIFCFPAGGFIGFFVGLLVALLDSGKSTLICPTCGIEIRSL